MSGSGKEAAAAAEAADGMLPPPSPPSSARAQDDLLPAASFTAANTAPTAAGGAGITIRRTLRVGSSQPPHRPHFSHANSSLGKSKPSLQARRQSVASTVTSLSSTFKPYQTGSSITSQLTGINPQGKKAKRPSTVVKQMPDKVCEGRMQLFDVKLGKWRPAYTVVTTSEIYVFSMQKEAIVSRLGYKTGKSRMAIGALLCGPCSLTDGMQFTFLSDTALGKRQSFKISSARYAIYLSLATDGKGDAARERESAMMDRWVRALQAHMVKTGRPSVSCLPVSLSSTPSEATSCALCGCPIKAEAARHCMWFPKPPLSSLAAPCPHYLTSSLVCEPCKVANDSARLKRAHMNVVYRRVLESGNDVAHDPALSYYALRRDATNLSWRMERPQSIVAYKEDVAREPIRAGRPCPGGRERRGRSSEMNRREAHEGPDSLSEKHCFQLCHSETVI